MRARLSPAGWTIAGFGLAALLLGATGLISPQALLRILGFDPPSGARQTGDYTLVFVRASAMASFNMGVYYLLAAVREWTAFFRFTVGFRLITMTIFTCMVVSGAAPGRFLAVAAWEGLGALCTYMMLRRRVPRQTASGRSAQTGP